MRTLPWTVSETDLHTCRVILSRGSKSFAFASHALPARLRDRFAAYYAFCRISDDAVDASPDPDAAMRALRSLRTRVDAAAAGFPVNDPVDRGLAWLIHAHGLPRTPIDALLEGYAWDVERRRYRTPSDTLAYAARVASSVGVALTFLMGVRDRGTLARAADLGAAMQCTNIARDVGEDARNGRVYLPEAWLEEERVAPHTLSTSPRFEPALGRVVARLLDRAASLYARAEPGIERLPSDCRLAIRAASLLYADIGRVIRRRRYDTVSRRASTTTARKSWLLARAALETNARGGRSMGSAEASALPEAAFLLEGIGP